MKIAIGSDHAGFELKEKIKQHLLSQGFDVDDRGTHSSQSVDYPDYARAVGEQVAGKKADTGILVCGTGIGMSIAANKVPGIRAAHVSTEIEAQLSREHNDANVIGFGDCGSLAEYGIPGRAASVTRGQDQRAGARRSSRGE